MEVLAVTTAGILTLQVSKRHAKVRQIRGEKETHMDRRLLFKIPAPQLRAQLHSRCAIFAVSA
jgi:hypothetical protein